MLARTLRDVFNTANPAPLASDDPRYVDCTSVRGNEDVVEQLFRRVTWSDQSHTAQLFTGHRGCGKSTELLRLKQRLEAADYTVIYFEADEVIDVEDVVYSDILVALARQVYEGFEQLKVPLDQQLLDDICLVCGKGASLCKRQSRRSRTGWGI
jgi:energy-coupling factor transporter ATP-binding protein EcfA2